ncbi:hypothetical protein R3I93_016803 [Phoxinus phoxinus]|uniref:Ig-like domain-containing protein n=1 Tax=Phoxinus phoxinus TaxID=58324 RepID=A0AAN9GZ70_9TELE
MKKFIVLYIYIPLVYSGIHSLKTAYTAIYGKMAAGTPEFSAVTTLDGQQIDYYDSNIKKMIPKQIWMEDYASTDLWTEDIEIREHVQHIYRDNIHVLKQRFNQTHHGVHTFQRMYGCECGDETGYSKGFDQYAYDGENFISLDLKENRYIASVQQGSPTAMKWNNDKTQLRFLKQYYDHDCVYWLKEFLRFRKEDPWITAPEVSLLQKNPSSPVVCHATGFYSSRVIITWLRNGCERYRDVDVGEPLPNEDGTFQKKSTLSVSPDEWKNNQFTCEVEHQGNIIQKNLTEDEIKSNYKPTELYATILVYVMGVFIVLVIGAVSYIKIKKQTNRYTPLPCSEDHLYIDKGL